MFPQPRVDTRTGQGVLLDDVLGPWFSVLVWGNGPRHVFDRNTLDTLNRLGVNRYVAAAALAQSGSSVVASLATAVHLTPGEHHDARPRRNAAQPAAGALAAAG